MHVYSAQSDIGGERPITFEKVSEFKAAYEYAVVSAVEDPASSRRLAFDSGHDALVIHTHTRTLPSFIIPPTHTRICSHLLYKYKKPQVRVCT